MSDLTNVGRTAIDLREKLGCPIVVISKETRTIANELKTRMVVHSGDRGQIFRSGQIFTSIEQSGWWFEVAEEGYRSERYDPLEVERKQQAVLKAAGIVDDATAIAWMVERDRAEYDALCDRHRAEISAFLASKRGGE